MIDCSVNDTHRIAREPSPQGSPASAASYRFHVLELFKEPIEAVKRISEVDVLVPSRLTVKHRPAIRSGPR